MSAEHVIKWTCNRCGTHYNSAPSTVLPADWLRIEVQDYYHSGTIIKDFCPDCAREFKLLLSDFAEEDE